MQPGDKVRLIANPARDLRLGQRPRWASTLTACTGDVS